MGIASALPAPNGYLLACVMVLVTQGNRDRPAGRVLSTLRSAAAVAARLWSAVREPVLLHPATPPCTGQLAA
jgi:hypothetical protein